MIDVISKLFQSIIYNAHTYSAAWLEKHCSEIGRQYNSLQPNIVDKLTGDISREMKEKILVHFRSG